MPADPLRWIGALAMLLALSAMILVMNRAGEDRGPARATSAAERSAAGGGLVGLAAAELEARFGAAAFVRNEGPVRLHRFADHRCTLFVFTVRADGGERVEHAESRANGGTQAIDVEACAGSLQRSRETIAAVR